MRTVDPDRVGIIDSNGIGGEIARYVRCYRVTESNLISIIGYGMKWKAYNPESKPPSLRPQGLAKEDCVAV